MAGSPRSSTSDLRVAAHVIGCSFAEQYYNLLHTCPEMVHKFYNPEPDADLIESFEINKRITAVDYRAFRTKITAIECAESYKGGVLVQVVGLIFHKTTAHSENFVQSFFLAPQKNEPRNYFILNDILWYLDRDLGHSKYQKTNDGTPARDPSSGLTGELSSPIQDEKNFSGTSTSLMEPTIQDDRKVLEAEDEPNGIEDSSQVHSTPVTNEPPVPSGEETAEEASKMSSRVRLPAPSESVEKTKEAPTPSPIPALSPVLPIEEASKEAPTPSPITAPSAVLPTEESSKDREDSLPSTAPSPIPSNETLKEDPKSISYASVVRSNQESGPPLATTGQGALQKEDPRPNIAAPLVGKQALNLSRRSTSAYTGQGPLKKEGSLPNVAAPPVDERASISSRPTFAATGQGALNKEGSPPSVASLPACEAPILDSQRGSWLERSVFIANVPHHMRNFQLREGFRRFGDIQLRGQGINIFRRERYAFIAFEQSSSARAAIESSPVIIHGHRFTVQKRRANRNAPRKSPQVHHSHRSF